MDFISSLSLERGLSLLVLFILFYSACLLVFFSLIFASSKASLGSLVGLRHLNSFFFFKFLALVSLLALAGLPPMLGFFIKSLLVLFFFHKGALFALYFFVFNLFSLYFYLNVSRTLVLGSSKSALLSHSSRVRTSAKVVLAMLLPCCAIAVLPLLLDSLILVCLNLVS